MQVDYDNHFTNALKIQWFGVPQYIATCKGFGLKSMKEKIKYFMAVSVSTAMKKEQL